MKQKWIKLSAIFALVFLFSLLIQDSACQSRDTKQSLIEKILESNYDGITVTFEDTAAYRKRRELERAAVKNSQSQKDKCISGLRDMTESLLKSPYSKMLSASAKDVNDLGNSKSCRDLEGQARYYILSVGVKQLPLALRFGLCLPYECTSDIMNEALAKIVNTTNEVVESLMTSAAGKIQLPTDVIPIIKLEAISSEKWDNDQKESKLTGSYLMITVTGMLCILVFLGTSYYHMTIEHYQDQKGRKLNNKTDENKYISLSNTGGMMNENTEESGMKLKLDNVSSTYEYSQTIDNFSENRSDTSRKRNVNNEINYSLYEGMTNALRKRITKSKNVFKSFKEKPILKAFLSCFSLQISFESLVSTRRNDEEHEELEVLEGIRTLSMFWGIFTATSLYVLTAYVQNIYEMLHLFESILFTMVASGNLAPDLFIFIGVFLCFVKINQLYDQRNGMKISLYIKLILYRYFKIAPLYYFVFFFGWTIFPYISNADTW